MRQKTAQTSNTPTMESMNTSVQETVGASIARGAVYLGAAWQDHIQHEFEAHSVEDTQEVHWQGTRHVLGPWGFYVPDSTRASWSMVGQYNQGKEGVATAYEWFLNLPPVVPLLVMWVVGLAILGTCALVVYWVGRLLVGLMAGAI
jgi:hypothetical protein